MAKVINKSLQDPIIWAKLIGCHVAAREGFLLIRISFKKRRQRSCFILWRMNQAIGGRMYEWLRNGN
jgi:hypothetical protein